MDENVRKDDELFEALSRSMQPQKRQTITPDEFRALAKDFQVTLPEKFLFKKES